VVFSDWEKAKEGLKGRRGDVDAVGEAGRGGAEGDLEPVCRLSNFGEWPWRLNCRKLTVKRSCIL
jgi:hypothetical protein